jgi:hypothetical protein
MVHSDINRIYKMKCKLQHLKATLGRPNWISSPALSFRDVEAKGHIQKAIEELHEAEMCLRKYE